MNRMCMTAATITYIVSELLWLLLSQIQMQTCPQNQVPRVRSHCSMILGLKLFSKKNACVQTTYNLWLVSVEGAVV